MNFFAAKKKNRLKVLKPLVANRTILKKSIDTYQFYSFAKL